MPFVALAGIGVIGEALIVLGIIAGVLLIGYLIARFGGYVPLVGSWLAVQAQNFFTWSVQQLQGTFEGALWALTNLVSIVVITVTFPFNQILRFTTATANALWWLRYVQIPAVISATYSWVSANLVYVQNYAVSLYNIAINALNVGLASAYALTVQALNLAYAYTSQALTLSYAYSLNLYYTLVVALTNLQSYVVTGLYSLALSTSQELINLQLTFTASLSNLALSFGQQLISLEQRLTALITQYVAAAEKDALNIVDVEATSALTAVWPGLISDVDGIIDAIPGELSDVLDDLRAIPRTVPIGLVDALAGVGALSVPLLRYLKECGVPMCRDLHGLSDILGGLLDAGTDAALLALIIEAVRDPHGASRDLQDVAGPVVRDAQSLFTGLLGR